MNILIDAPGLHRGRRACSKTRFCRSKTSCASGERLASLIFCLPRTLEGARYSRFALIAIFHRPCYTESLTKTTHSEEPEIRNRILWEGVRIFLGVGGNRSARRKPAKADMESANQIHIQPLASCIGERKVYEHLTNLATGVVCHPDTKQNMPYKIPWSCRAWTGDLLHRKGEHYQCATQVQILSVEQARVIQLSMDLGSKHSMYHTARFVGCLAR